MGSQLTVRRYRPGDVERVRELHEAAMRDVGAYVEGGPDEDLENITESYLDTGGEFLVGTIDDRLVAMGAFQPVADDHYLWNFVSELPTSTVELTRMRIDPDHQRQGYGQAIYEALEARMRSNDYHHVVLDTRAIQTAAQAFYETNGFELTSRERIDSFDEPFELLVYEKSLTSGP
ncbi:GNAT family N-acetyltransferase [Halosolutus halophilus]|uniref:GNAT family N-acetyltransferase n=1 Tax=Halosolutus halophilus TaxID=1552990 RepID=UPI0022352A3F|nr:GNAT family N-acetyltransferase [Halosolutus halophilus]